MSIDLFYSGHFNMQRKAHRKQLHSIWLQFPGPGIVHAGSEEQLKVQQGLILLPIFVYAERGMYSLPVET